MRSLGIDWQIASKSASTSFQNGFPEESNSHPLTAGLYAPTFRPALRQVLTSAAATTVLPTFVSVPVINRPRVLPGGLIKASDGTCILCLERWTHGQLRIWDLWDKWDL